MNLQEDLKFLSYITKFIYKHYDNCTFVLYMFAIYNRIEKLKPTFQLKTIDSHIIESFLKNEDVKDINNTIIIDNSILHYYIKYLIIIIQQEDEAPIKRKVHAIRTNLEDRNTVLISNTLLYNLKNTTVCRLQRLQTCWQCANEIELALINSPHDWDNSLIDLVVKNYFTRPKIVNRNDVIEINLREFGKRIVYSKNLLINSDDKVYFKCNKIIYKDKLVDGGYLCITNETTLKQSSNIQSFIPRNLRSLPLGLDQYYQDLIRAFRPFVKREKLQMKPVFLLEGCKGSGKSLLVNYISAYYGMHLHTIYSFDVAANVYAQNEVKLRNILFTTKMAAPCVLEIKNFENFGKNSDGQYDDRIIEQFIIELNELFTNCEFPIILCCCTNEKEIPLELRRIFLKTFTFTAPNAQERFDILKWILEKKEHQTHADLNEIANKTHGFVLGDLNTLIYHALKNLQNDTAGECNQTKNIHFINALNFMQSKYNQSLGAPKIPTVLWSDIGGLNDIKDEIMKLIKWPLEHPKLLKSIGIKRSGILLYGPPGTGKTLTAKAAATECGLCFLSIKGPELLNMYVGQSEQNVREVFERAREASPCIIFFDELDSLAPNRGASGDSGGVMDRVVSQLLAEMDGLSHTDNVFIIGATNRPDLIDPALLRPGRYDKLLYVGPCIDRNSKLSVLKALTRKFQFENGFNVEEVVDVCPENFSGADFYGLCSSAWMSATRRLIIEYEMNSSQKSLSQEDIKLNLNDFITAIVNVKPSITKEDLEYFKQLKNELS